MRTFLDQAAEQIIQSERDFESIKIVVPSNRAILFLKHALKQQLDRPHFAPKICAIDQFVGELSGLKKAAPTELLLRLYEVYLQNTPIDQQESFQQYLSWAEILLKEFNEMDANLVDTKALFKALEAYKALAAWNVQTPLEQDLVKHYLKFNQALPALYQNLYQVLLEEEEGYSGMRYREAVSNIEYYLEANHEHHFFIGFNALNKAEEFLFQEFLAQQKATLLWDIDSSFYEDWEHPAGHFIRQYFKQWPGLKNLKQPSWGAHFEEEKVIEIIGLPKNISQVQWATQLLEKKFSKGVALVLGEESSLTPMLASLNETHEPWNVTMGFPLAETPAATFFDLFFKLHQEVKSDTYDFFTLQDLLSAAQCDALLSSYQQEMQPQMRKFQKQKQFQIPVDKLIGTVETGAFKHLLFAPFYDVETFIERLQQLASHFKTFWAKTKSDFIIAGHFENIEHLFEAMQLHLQQYSFVKTLADLHFIFQKLLQKEKLSFSGNPLEGLQIMGLLETRLLDFETVIVTHLNEGVLPAGKTSYSWIPFSLKKQFEMPTFVEQDYLYSYHFFRLLQRAKNIFLLYNSTSEGLYGGEKSRFLYQLEYLKKPKHKLRFSQPKVEITRQSLPFPKVEKSTEVMTQLHTLASSGFSPSSLTTFWRDPYQFYERYLLKIQPHQPIEKTLQANEKGTLMHAVLESLYAPYVGQTLSVSDYDALQKNVLPILLQSFQKEFGNTYTIKGKNYLLFQSMKGLLLHFLNDEQKWVAQGNQLKIIALEKAVEGFVMLPDRGIKIKLKGFVDRIDQANGQVRIIDYKTGSVLPKNLEIDQWDNLFADSSKSPLFQVLLYGYLLQSEFKNQNMCAGIIPFKTYTNSFLEAKLISEKQKFTIVFSDTECRAFEVQLCKLLSSLFDPKIPFLPTR